MKILNHILSFLGVRTNIEKGSAEGAISDAKKKSTSNDGQLCTIYRLGPSYLTYQHHIDINPLK